MELSPYTQPAGPEKLLVPRLLIKHSVHLALLISWHSSPMDCSRGFHRDPQKLLQALSPSHIPLKQKVSFREGQFQNWNGGMTSNLVHSGSTSYCKGG